MHANKPAVAVGLEGRSVLRDFASPKAGTANVKLAIDLRALRNFAKLNKRPIFVCICVPSWFNLNVYSWFTIRLGRSLALADLPLSIRVHLCPFVVKRSFYDVFPFVVERPSL
jgi:hypothetical protein